MDKKKILIVDDQHSVRVLLTEVFLSEGLDIFQCENGQQAVKMYQEVLPDVVLLDIRMPVMNGDVVLEKLKEINPDVKIIIMTAHGDIELISKCMRLGALHIFTKPFNIEELRHAVMHALLQENNSIY